MRYYLRPAQKEDAAAIAAIRGVADKETAAVVEAGVVDPGRQLMVALAATVDDKGEGAKADDVVVGVAEWSIPGNREADEEVAALLREGIGEESADGMYGTLFWAKCRIYLPSYCTCCMLT